ncbi:unnamed protein product [Heligmosomoides polygyrus]|uniref:Uncharacterized protein n=1 Tax=Heligmosomoides polygyrus TaxID=6339 RepID=A0A183FPH0_HELPZ|nr:unnamed protein product [Heligmosomoides polygyrus]
MSVLGLARRASSFQWHHVEVRTSPPRSLLSLTREAEPRAKEAVVRAREELGDSGDIGQVILAVEDDVVDLVVELATGGFAGPSYNKTVLLVSEM